MVRFIIEHRGLETPQQRGRLDVIEFDLQLIKDMLMALSPEVQKLLDVAAQTKNVVDANNAAFAALQKHTDDLTKQLADVLNRPQVTGLSDEDKAGIATTVSEMQDIIAKAPQNIVANTGQTGSDGNTGTGTEPAHDAETIAPAPVPGVPADAPQPSSLSPELQGADVDPHTAPANPASSS